MPPAHLRRPVAASAAAACGARRRAGEAGVSGRSRAQAARQPPAQPSASAHLDHHAAAALHGPAAAACHKGPAGAAAQPRGGQAGRLLARRRCGVLAAGAGGLRGCQGERHTAALCVAPLPAAARALDDTAGECLANVPGPRRCWLSMSPGLSLVHAGSMQRSGEAWRPRGAPHTLCMLNSHVVQRRGGVSGLPALLTSEAAPEPRRRACRAQIRGTGRTQCTQLAERPYSLDLGSRRQHRRRPPPPLA